MISTPGWLFIKPVHFPSTEIKARTSDSVPLSEYYLSACDQDQGINVKLTYFDYETLQNHNWMLVEPPL